MFTCSISGCPRRGGTHRDEESLGIYREVEAHPAVGLPFSCDLECALDGWGGDPHPVGECAFSDLDCHAYNLGAPFSFASHLQLPECTTTAGSFYQETYRPSRWSGIIRKEDQGVEIAVNNRRGLCANLIYPPHDAAVHRNTGANPL